MPTKGSLFFKIYILNITFLFYSIAMANYALTPFFVMLKVNFGIWLVGTSKITKRSEKK